MAENSTKTAKTNVELKQLAAKRRLRIRELLPIGLRPAEIARACTAEGLLEAASEEVARQIISRDLAAITKELAKENPRSLDKIELVRDTYIAQQQAVFREALTKFRSPATMDGLRVGYLRIAMEASELVAAVHGINTRPRFRVEVESTEKFDPAREAAEKVIERQRARASGKLIDIKKLA